MIIGKMSNHLYFLFLISILFGCGGSSSISLNGKYSANDVAIIANEIEIGEAVRTEVFFETKTEIDGTPDGVDLIVRIPKELSFVDGSSRLYDGNTDNTDAYTPNDIVRCETGETFLVYNFSDFDLYEHEIEGFGKFGIRFEVRGLSRTNATFVEASAGDGEFFECGQIYVSEVNEAVAVI